MVYNTFLWEIAVNLHKQYAYKWKLSHKNNLIQLKAMISVKMICRENINPVIISWTVYLHAEG